MSSVAEKLAGKSNRKPPAKQVRLRLVYIDFWSAVKLSFLAAIAIAVVTVVAFVIVYLVVQTTGLIAKADEFFASFSDGSILLSQFVSFPQVLAFSAVVAILNLVVVTVLGAVIAGIYNLAVKVTGGLLVGFTSNCDHCSSFNVRLSIDSSIETSMCWPCPVAARWYNAAETAPNA